MKRTKRALATLALTVLVGCSRQALYATPPTVDMVALEIQSTEDSLPLLNFLASQFADEFPNYLLEPISNTQSNLLSKLQNGEIDYFISHHLPSNFANYWAAPLAQDALAIVVNVNNSVSNLNSMDIWRVYRGYLTNWAELGADEGEISLYSRASDIALRQEFERLIMGQERISPNALLLPSSESLIERVSQDRNAIAYLPFSLLDESVKVLAVDAVMPSTETINNHRYSLRMTVYLIGLVPPNEHYQAFLAMAQSLPIQENLQDYAPLPP